MTEQVGFEEDWRGFQGVFGGRVIAALGEAAVRDVEGFDLLSLSVEFCASVDVGRAELEVVQRHLGRRTGSIEVTLIQGHPRARAVAKLGRVVGRELGGGSVDLSGTPGAHELVPFDAPYADQPWSRLLEVRLLRDGGATVGAGGNVTSRSWIRLDGSAGAVRNLDVPGRAAVLVDAVPPGLLLGERLPSFVPTLDFTLHLRPGARAAAGAWHLATSTTVWAREDFCMEDITLVDAGGQVVAQARQNRRVIWAR